MSKDIAYDFFPFYAAKFLADTSQWSDEMCGLHIRLLCMQWENGFIEANKHGNPVGFTGKKLKLWDSISHKYVFIEGRLFNQKLEFERMKVFDKTAARSAAGKAGNEKRWKDHIAKVSQKGRKAIANTSQNDRILKEELKVNTNTPLAPEGELSGERFEIEKEIMADFGFTEMNNPQKAILINRFCTTLKHRGRLEYFTEQFTAYLKLKKANTERKHWFKNLEKFLGSGREYYEDGLWQQNWVLQLKEFNQTHAVKGGSNVLPGNFFKK